MAIYRGPGGAGDATTDSSTEAAAAVNAAAQAATSATQAASSATQSANSATAASSSASSASTSASTATTKANEAASSASAASVSALAASTSATNAAASASTATTQANNASTSATSASTSASTAQSAATLATSKATDASNAASVATTKATEASTSATNAATSETNAASSASSASTSASTATTQASNAATSATAAATSASTATTKASEAATSATNAATSATNAANSATAAATSATNASNSASAASTSATNAASSATSAASSASAAAASYDSFDDRYLGSKSSAPTLDNDGNALLTGALYFDTTSNSMKVYNGTAWLDAYASLSGALLATNNLSDLNSVSTARTNLGLGTAALVADNTLVHLAGTETITGAKTFSSTITGSITGNAGTVTNGVYTTGSYADPTWLTSIAGSKVSGNISGNAATATTATNQSGGTVAATTLSASSTVTLSGGTANGVAYLNGSKVLTTGSALTFDGANLGVSNHVTIGDGNRYRWGDGTSVFLAASNAAGVLGFYTGGSEQMRLTSTGLGIGTSSPQVPLTLNASGQTTQLGGYAGTTFLWGVSRNASNGLNLDAYGDITFQTNSTTGAKTGTERMRIDSSGNVGIGTTSPSTRLHVVGSGIKCSTSITIGDSVGGNYEAGSIYADSNWGMIIRSRTTSPATGTAFAFMQSDGTESMRINTSGNVGIGTSSPTARLHISGGTTAALYVAGGAGSTIRNAASSGSSWFVGTNVDSYILHNESNTPMLFTTNGTERMRIDSSGNLLVGGTSAYAKFTVFEGNAVIRKTSGSPIVTCSSSQASGYAPSELQLFREGASGTATPSTSTIGEIRFDGLDSNNSYDNMGLIGVSMAGANAAGGAASYMYFQTASSGSGSTERMRIDSSGNVGIGTSSAYGRITVCDPAQSAGSNPTTFPSINILQGSASLNSNGGLDFRGSSYGNGYGFRISAIDSSGVHLVIGNRQNATTFTEVMRIDSSGNLLFNSGYGSAATAYGCRAWVNFNGTGTVAIRASGNVSSITDNGTDDYTVNFTNAMVDANYATILTSPYGITAGYGFGNYFDHGPTSGIYQTTASTRVSAWNGSNAGTYYDSPMVNIAIFR